MWVCHNLFILSQVLIISMLYGLCPRCPSLCLLEVMVLERRDKNELIGSDQRVPGGAKAMSLENMDPQEGVVESSMQGWHHSIWAPQGLLQDEEWGEDRLHSTCKGPGARLETHMRESRQSGWQKWVIEWPLRTAVGREPRATQPNSEGLNCFAWWCW